MLRAWIIEKLGGYPDLDAAIDAIRFEPDAKHKRAILTMTVKRLFATIGPEDILREAPEGGWLYQGKHLSKAQVATLRDEARVILKSSLWKVIQTDLIYHSMSKAWKESEDIADLTAAKLLAFYADIVNTRLKRMAPE